MFDHNETLAEARARNVRDALFEDVGIADWTGHLIPAERRVRAAVRVREAAVLCGRDWFDACLHALDPNARITWHCGEGALTTPDASSLAPVARSHESRWPETTTTSSALSVPGQSAITL